MKTLKKTQSGFSLMSVMLGLVLVSAMLIGATNIVVDKLNKRKATEFRAHIELVIAQIQQYQYFMVTEQGINPASPTTFPDNLDGLMYKFPDQFWPRCSLNDEQKGACKRPDGLPWSNLKLKYELTFGGIPRLPSVLLTFPLSSIPINERALWASELQRLPFARTQPNGDITVKINDPLIMSVYKEFLKRDGSVQLTDAWDVGNQSILNAKAVSVRTQNNTQQRLGLGIVSQYLAIHGDRINKNAWSCAVGLKQTLHLSVNTIASKNDQEKYLGIGGFKPFVVDKGAYWEVMLEYNVKIKRGSSETWVKRNSGYVTVSQQCSSN